MTRDERLALLDFHDADLTVMAQTELLGLNRSSLYYKPVQASPEELVLKHRIDEIYTEYPFYGSRRIAATLRRDGQQGFTCAQPSILNSGQGSHFTSPAYITLLQAAEVQISMDSKGRATDNIFTERLWRSLKYESVYLQEYAIPRQAREGINRYLAFYNNTRPHQSLNYQTPSEVYHRQGKAV